MYLIPHVASERQRKLDKNLRIACTLNVDYFVLTGLSSVIATLGLFLNSPAVIIGAMIIAPLMRPLLGMSLGVLCADLILIFRAAVALLSGTIFGGTIAFLMAGLLGGIELTPEMLARIRPNLLDLGVALAAGATGAYCKAKEELSDTIAGVAIAVALMPPLCVSGIGLARASLDVWGGATLLYLTNLIGITVAGSLVFFVMGFSPIWQAKRGLAVSSVSLLVLMVPLGLSMHELLIENELSRQIRTLLQEKTYTFKRVRLEGIEVNRFKHPMQVVATVYNPGQEITPHQVRLVEDFLVRETGVPLSFSMRIIPAEEVASWEVSPYAVTPGQRSGTTGKGASPGVRQGTAGQDRHGSGQQEPCGDKEPAAPGSLQPQEGREQEPAYAPAPPAAETAPLQQGNDPAAGNAQGVAAASRDDGSKTGQMAPPGPDAQRPEAPHARHH